MTVADIGPVLDRMTRLPAGALASELSVAEARARVLPAGVAIAAGVADLVRPGSIVVARSGIRAGLLLEGFGLAAAAGEEGGDGVV
jgi:exopolyphosphatase/pppGpp-phosphohydrolase